MKALYKISVVELLVVGLFVTSAFADVGSNNPTGTSGRFNELITTGCSYDPYTANATRSVTDLVVAGAVGTYPLAFTRTMTSRYTAGLTAEFGQAGNWLHSYSWSIDEAYITSGAPTNTPNSYTVHYPDGGTVIFSGTQTGDPDFRGPSGVRDRFEQIKKMTVISGGGSNSTKYADVYLRLPDGGKIWFTVLITTTINPAEPGGPRTTTYDSDFVFTLAGIIDPYGQKTTIAAPGDGSVTITEPAGRMLKIWYKNGPAGDYVIDRVEEWYGSPWKGRTVTYNYSQLYGMPYSALTSVSYPDGSSASYTYQPSNNTSSNGSSRLLIKTAVDPMYPGPMWSIGYYFLPYSNYGGVYGQLWGEALSPDGVSVGAVVSQLGVTGTSTRTEYRGDGPSRTFSYGSSQPGFSVPAAYMLGSVTDFNGVNLYKSYDPSGFVNAIKDRNGNTTTYQNDPLTGNVTLTTYPLTASDRALGRGPATSQISYTGSGSDPNNPYYVYGYTNTTRRGSKHGRHRGSDKRGFTDTYVRDGNNRVTQINYPDGGVEGFVYDYDTHVGNFGQVVQHRLKVGGLETYTYDSRGRLTEYRDAYHLSTADPQNPSVPTNATPSLAYTYDAQDRVYTITDARSNTTSFTYNNRGQLLTTTPPGVAHPITNIYNTNNGTLAAVINELQKQTFYAYDDYKRLIGIYLPPPSGGPSPNPTTSSYDHTGGTASDYSHADANPTRVTLPSGKITKTVYDNNMLKSSVTVGYNTSDAATTMFAYDNNGNLKKITDPKQNLTQNYYDEQNRLTDVDDPMVNDATTPHKNSNGHTVSYTYDQANNKLTKLSANNQLVNYLYDSMNHVYQVKAQQDPDPTAYTNYTYYTSGPSSGLLYLMQDPHLLAIGSNACYGYTYDLMGRKTSVVYPPADSNSAAKNESWTYDTAGNLATFTNRATNVQTFSYDSRNRQTGFTWNDGVTPSQTIGYDDASRVTQISNSNATVKKTYFDDNTLKSQEEWAAAEGVHRIANYTYDPDLNRETIAYPGSHSFSYAYTNRDQVTSIQDTTASNYPVTYKYDGDGDVDSETEGGTVTTTVTPNAMNLVKHLSRGFVGTTRTFDYGYDAMNDRTSIQQDGGTPKTEAYDLAEQATTETINGTATTFNYDANGNRTGVNGTGTYATNNLNEYTTFNATAVGYDSDGNLATYNVWTYTYDAQNRMIIASNGSTTETFKYDGLNRQISHKLNSATTYNVWDGWNLIEEFAPGGSVPTSVYVYGARGEIVERMSGGSTILYFQDALGNTSHVSDSSGHLLESYTYSRTGTPTFYNASGGQITASAHGIRHLFHGQLWTQETGLNDYRNRMQLPAMGVFMQTDPIGFAGGNHLYRFCGNNALNASDPLGLDVQPSRIWVEAPPVEIPGQSEYPGTTAFNDPIFSGGPGDLGFGPEHGDFPSRDNLPGLPSAPAGYPYQPGQLPPNPFSGNVPFTLGPPALPSATAPATANPTPTSNIALGAFSAGEIITAAATASAVATIVAVQENRQVWNVESHVDPGQTVYMKDIYATILSGLFDQDVYLQISVDQHGQIHENYVVPKVY